MGAADALGFACPTSAIGRFEAAVAEADAATPCSGNASDRRNQTDTSAAEGSAPSASQVNAGPTSHSSDSTERRGLKRKSTPA
jgi:hypothetical protein